MQGKDLTARDRSRNDRVVTQEPRGDLTGVEREACRCPLEVVTQELGAVWDARCAKTPRCNGSGRDRELPNLAARDVSRDNGTRADRTGNDSSAAEIEDPYGA
jgi:hypothetical protein